MLTWLIGNAAGEFLPLSGGQLFTGFQQAINHGEGIEIFAIVDSADGGTAIEILSEASGAGQGGGGAGGGFGGGFGDGLGGGIGG